MAISILAVLVLLCALTLTVPCEAKIPVLSLEKLVRQADVICIAETERKELLPDDQGRVTVVRNHLKLTSCLKGTAATAVVVTKKRRREDNLTVPAKGPMLLFLKRGNDDLYYPVNSIQGVWPLDKGSPQGMGLGITVQQVIDEIYRQHSETAGGIQ